MFTENYSPGSQVLVVIPPVNDGIVQVKSSQPQDFPVYKRKNIILFPAWQRFCENRPNACERHTVIIRYTLTCCGLTKTITLLLYHPKQHYIPEQTPLKFNVFLHWTVKREEVLGVGGLIFIINLRAGGRQLSCNKSDMCAVRRSQESKLFLGLWEWFW